MGGGLDVKLPDEEDPIVLSPQLILQALKTDVQEDTPAELQEEEREEDTDYFIQHSSSIRLEFKKIVKIENLESLRGLTHLFLDNNFIEDITGLESLVHLEWLDLSFNRISVLENLDAQVNLKVLAVFNNEISKIENIAHMQKLEVLRVGNNKIHDSNDIIYLRKLKALRTLSLKGNPLAEEKEIDGYIAAFLPNLVYYEFKMVDAKLRKSYTEKNQGEIFKVVGSEQKDEMQKRHAHKEFMLHQKEREAFIEKLRGKDLLQLMFSKHVDEEAKIVAIQYAPEAKEKFEDDFLTVMDELYNLGLKELEKRKSELEDIDSGILGAKEQIDNDDIQYDEAFTEEKNELLENLTDLAETLGEMDPDCITETQAAEVENLREEYKRKLKMLRKKLMENEILLMNSIEAMIEDYENKLNSMTKEFLDNCGNLLQKARDLETLYFHNLLDIIDMTSSVRADSMLDIVAICHDFHQELVDSRQKDLRLAVNTWREEHFKQLRDKEFNRSRARVLEICQFTDTVAQQLEDIEVLPPAIIHEEDV